MKAILHRTLFVASTGWILMYFSEHLFWARYRPGEDSIGGYLLNWFFYSMAGYAALLAISAFNARSWESVFLAGALFGWLIEGVVVETMYAAIPLSISFTPLAWHAAISVMIGLRSVPRWLSGPHLRAWVLCSLVGLGYGVWAINWWWEEPETTPATPAEFAAFSVICAAATIVAYAIFASERRRPTTIHRKEAWIPLTVFVFLFAIKAALIPISLLVLPPLVALVLFALRQNRIQETRGSELTTTIPDTTLWSLFPVLAIPATATAFYSVANSLDLTLPTNRVFYVITTPLGFLLLGVALWRTLRRTPLLPPTVRNTVSR